MRYKACFYTDSSAPCMVLARPLRKDVERRIVRTVKRNGGPEERTALLSWDAVEETIPRRAFRQLSSWGSVTVILDGEILGNLYGYDAAEVL